MSTGKWDFEKKLAGKWDWYPPFRTLFEISARLKLVSVPFSSLVLNIGHLEKSFPESIM